MMEWLKAITAQARDELETSVARYKNREFMRALVSACALVSLADGVIAPEEKRKMQQFLERSPELRVFKTSEVIAVFNEMVEAFDFDFELGKHAAMKAIRVVRGQGDAPFTLVRVCCVIGASDGHFDDDEKAVVADICRELDLDPKTFGLSSA